MINYVRLAIAVCVCLMSHYSRSETYDFELSETFYSHRATVRQGYNIDKVYPAQRIYKVPVFKGETVGVTITFSTKMSSGCSSGAFYCFVNGVEVKTASGYALTYKFNLTSDSTIKVFASAGGGSDSVSSYYSETTYTITATFPMRYTVTYHPGSGDITTKNGKDAEDMQTKYPSGGIATITNEVYYRSGYRQRGWTKSDCGTAKYLDFGDSVTMYGNETLYPYWEKVPTYTIRYLPDSNSTGTATPTIKTQGLPVALLKNAPFKRTDHVQTGWSLSENGSAAFALGAQYEEDEDMTLYPYWVNKADIVTYKAGRQGLGGELTDVKSNSVPLRLPGAIYFRKGYRQCGWTTNDGGIVTHKLFSYYETQKTQDFYPVWTPDPAANKTYMVVDLSGGSSSEQYPVSYLSDVPAGGWTDEYKTSKLVLRRVMIPNSAESTYLQSKASYYYIGIFEVTKRQYNLVLGSASGDITEEDMLPFKSSYKAIHYANYKYSTVNADGFIGRIRAKTGIGSFDVPSATQWTYACRAGTDEAQGWGDHSVGYDRNSNTLTLNLKEYAFYADTNPDSLSSTKVGSFLPNAWGIYDMLGNATEWSSDYKVVDSVTSNIDRKFWFAMHGGGSGSSTENCKCSHVYYQYPDYGTAGFRLYCPADEITTPVYEIIYSAGAYGMGEQVEDAKIQSETVDLRDSIFTRSGYRQVAWQDADGNQYELGGAYATDATITLCPVWEAETYNVTYNPGANGMGTYPCETKINGVALTLPGAVFTRSGYTQSGWSITDGGVKKYELGGAYGVDADIILYPYWTQNASVPSAPVISAVTTVYTPYAIVSWNAASGATSYNVYRSSTITRPATPLKSGLTVRSYYDSSALPGMTYYYWIEAVNSSGSSVSSYKSGYRAVQLSLSGTSFAFEAGGGSSSVTITANTNWTATTSSSWITLGRQSETASGTLSLTVSANTGTSARTGAIVIKAGPNSDHPTTMTISITQAAYASVDVPTATDNTTLTFATGGNASWIGQSEVTHDGVDAVRSGSITHSQTSWMETSLTGAGTISFWWYADSESENYDYLFFSVDGVQTNKIGGTSCSWIQCQYELPEGSHTLRWTYRKDSSVSKGKDAGFVDQVVWTPKVNNEDFLYKIENGSVIITNYVGNGGDVVVPASIGGLAVSEIGEDAFYGNEAVTSVKIPSSVGKIGDTAFGRCKNMVSIEIPDGVTNIEAQAFFRCNALTSVTIPRGVTKIPYWAFNQCNALKSVTIPNGVTYIGNGAFSFCYQLETIRLPEGVTFVGYNAFDYSGLKTIALPMSTKTIASYAFMSCSSLATVTLHSNVTSIGDDAFEDCDALSTVYVDSGDANRIRTLLTNSGLDCSGIQFVEIGSGGESVVPDTEFWSKYPDILQSAGGDTDVAKMLTSPGKSGKGKFKPNGDPVKVWEDYVAGTNPEDENDLFTAKVELVGGKPVITWEPALNDTTSAKGVKNGTRTYRTFGKQSLNDKSWVEITGANESNYNFFKVTVEMP